MSWTIRHTAPVIALIILALPRTATRAAEVRYDNAAHTGFQLLEEPINPRSIAMGSSGAAGAAAGFALYNPALGGHLSSPAIRLEYGRGTGDLKRGYFETIWPLGQWRIGAAFNTYAIDGIAPVDELGRLPNYDLPFSQQLTLAALNAAWVASAPLTIGVMVAGVQDKIGADKSYAVSVSGGALYEIIADKLWAGAAGFHAGASSSFLDTAIVLGEGASLPMNGKAGLAWRDTVGTVAYSVHLDAVYRFTDKRIEIPAGVEIRPLELLAFRAGKRFNHDTELFALGAGLRLDPLAFDIAVALPKLVDDLQPRWLLSIDYRLGRARAAGGKEGGNGKKPVAPPRTDSANAPAPETSEGVRTEEAITEEAITEEAITEEAINGEAITEENVTEEVGDEEAGDEEAGDEEAGDEEAGDDEAQDDEAQDEEAQDEEAQDEEAVDTDDTGDDDHAGSDTAVNKEAEDESADDEAVDKETKSEDAESDEPGSRKNDEPSPGPVAAPPDEQPDQSAEAGESAPASPGPKAAATADSGDHADSVSGHD